MQQILKRGMCGDSERLHSVRLQRWAWSVRCTSGDGQARYCWLALSGARPLEHLRSCASVVGE